MFGDERLAEIERQQEELLLQSDLHRQMLALEAASWAQRFAWVDSASQTFSGARWWLLPVAAIGGIFAVRKWRTLVKWVPAALSVWKWAQRLRSG
jgi:hypothetical protein